MRFSPTIFGKLLEPVDRRQFAATVASHDADAYDKSFRSWDHLVALVFAQLSPAESLRGLVESWNANPQHHYHLGSGQLSRSTLADANARRPVGVFAETFGRLANMLDRVTRRDGAAMIRLIDSTPIPLGKLSDWAKSNGRMRGLKVHVLYDPFADLPRLIDITHANVNDAQVGRTIEIAPDATYVFDKGYCHYGWWTKIAAAGAIFVTRPKQNMRLETIAVRELAITVGDGCTILEDADVRLASKGDSKLPIPLRRIRILRAEDGKPITLLTNDGKRPAHEIAALYRGRWRIELLFRWMKQHLRIRRFLGTSDNAIRLQIVAAMIAYALVRIAARTQCVAIPILRFLELVTQCLFERRKIRTIERPPPVNPSRKRDRTAPNQLALELP